MKRILGLGFAACLLASGSSWAACTLAHPNSSTATRLGTQTADQAQITGGCIDGTPIGQNTTAAIAGTTIVGTTFNGKTIPVGTGTLLSTGGSPSGTTGMILTPLRMTEMRTAAGLMMTASASSTNFGLTYTPGTTAVLIGTATSSSTTGNTAALDFMLPSSYIAGSDITLKVGCYYTNSSSTASTHTMAAAAYLNAVDGTQGSTLIATAAQVCPITTSALQTYTITGTTLVPGSYLSLTFTAAVINGGGASTEWLTSASLN